MYDHIQKSVRESMSEIKASINQLSENAAELYVSSELGLSRDDESKEARKKEYKQMFLDRVIWTIGRYGPPVRGTGGVCYNDEGLCEEDNCYCK